MVVHGRWWEVVITRGGHLCEVLIKIWLGQFCFWGLVVSYRSWPLMRGGQTLKFHSLKTLQMCMRTPIYFCFLACILKLRCLCLPLLYFPFCFSALICNVFMASNDKQQCCHPKLATVPRLTSSIHLHWETVDIQPQSNLHQWQEICHTWLLTRYHEWQQAPKGHESLSCGRKQVPHFGYSGHKPTYKRGELYFVNYIKILLIILPILERVSWRDCCAWDTFLAVE